jgi:hypothetical protein
MLPLSRARFCVLVGAARLLFKGFYIKIPRHNGDVTRQSAPFCVCTLL